MRRTLLLGLAAIALLVGGGFAFVNLVTWETPVLREAPPPEAAASPASPLPERRPAPEPAAQGSTATVAESAKLATEDSAPPATARGATVHRAQGYRRTPRGAANGMVSGLGALQPRVAGCSKGTASGTAMLLLELEPLDGKIRVVDATIHSKGPATDATLACARDALKGQVLTVAEARPGKHVRVPYPLRF